MSNLLTMLNRRAGKRVSPIPGIYNVRSFGAKGDGVSDDSAAIQRAINRLTENAVLGTDRNVLFFPPGVYMVGTAIHLPEYTTHAFLKFEIRGSGKDNTILHQINYSTGDIFLFENVGASYVAAWTIRDIHFGPCCRAIHVDNAQYAQIINCAFKGNDWDRQCYGVELDGNASVWFRGCWWYHTGNTVWAKNGTVRMTDCRIGEDAGGIRIHGGLSMTNCVFRGVDKNEPSGYLGMGPSGIIVDGGSRFAASGCLFECPSNNLMTADLPSSLLLTGNEFVVSNDATVLKTRRLFGYQGATMTSNLFWFRGTGGALAATADGYPIRETVIKDNRVKLDSGSVASIDSSVFEASNNNIVKDNVGDADFLEAG